MSLRFYHQGKEGHVHTTLHLRVLFRSLFPPSRGVLISGSSKEWLKHPISFVPPKINVKSKFMVCKLILPVPSKSTTASKSLR